MANSILDKIVEDIPCGDEMLTKGLVRHQLANSAEIVHNIFLEASRHFPPILTYEGYHICSPEETYATILDTSIQKEYDIAKCSLYLASFKFVTTAPGGPVTIEKKILLPYVEHDGSIYLSGNRYYFKPVLTDRVISATGSGFFIRLMQDKFSCNEEGYNIRVDGSKRMVFVLKAPIFTRTRKMTKRKSRPSLPSAVGYILLKHGLKDAISKYFNLKYKAKRSTDITEEDRRLYMIFAGDTDRSTDISFMIPRDDIKTESMKEALEKFFGGAAYTIDVSNNLEKDSNKNIRIDTLDDPEAWKHAMTSILLAISKANSDNRAAISLIREINIHYSRIEKYLEKQLQEYLNQGGAVIEDFYDLLAYIIIHGKKLKSENNIWSRYMDISYYVFYNFIETIFTIKNTIQSKISSNSRLTAKDISKLMRKITPRTFLNITKGGKRSIVLDLIDFPGDNIYLGSTQNLTLQELGDGVNQSGRSNNKLLPGNLKRLHSYDIAIGSVLGIFKSRPTPRVRLNLFVEYDHRSGSIHASTRYRKKMDALQKILEGNEILKTKPTE